MRLAPDAGNLAAQPRRREDLARIAQAGRVERAAQQLHGVQVAGPEHLRHVLGLVGADPVLAGDRAAVGDAQVENGAGHLLGGLLRARYGVVEQNQRVQVAVAGVEHVRDPDPGRGGQLRDPVEHLGQRGPRHHAVLHDVGRADPAHRGERGLAPGPDRRALGRVVRRPDLVGAFLLADRTHRFGLPPHVIRGPVELDDQHRAGSLGVAAGHRGLGGLDRECVHHLDRGGQDAGADDRRNGGTTGSHGPERGQQGGHRLRNPGQLHDDLGSDAERALGADERANQVIAGGGAGAVAQPDQLPVRGHDLQASHVMHGEAVFEAVRPTGVLRHVAADRADHLAGRVGRVEEPERLSGLAHGQVGDAGLDDGPPALLVDRDDAAHLGGDDQDAVGPGERPAGQAGARAPGHERDLRPGADGDDGGDLLGRGRQHHEAGGAPVRGEPVTLVRGQLGRIGQHTTASADLGHPRDQCVDGGPSDLPCSLHCPRCPGRAGGCLRGHASRLQPCSVSQACASPAWFANLGGCGRVPAAGRANRTRYGESYSKRLPCPAARAHPWEIESRSPDGSTMAIAGRLMGQDGSPGRAGHSWASHAAAAVVLVIGLGITITLSAVTASGHHRTNAKLLALETRLISDDIAAADPLYVEDHLGGAASVAAATGGSAATFARELSGSGTAKGAFVTASLWRLGATSPRQITHVGTRPLLAPAGAAMSALLHRAAATRAFAVTKITVGRTARLGYATAATGTGGSFAAYAEVPLPAGGRVSEPASSPVSDLNIAVYLGRSQTRAALLEASAAVPLPLRGTTYATRIPFGDTVLTLTTSARGSLTGSLGVILPWAIGVGGAALTILGALLAERLVRRRARAERVSTEIGRLYVEQRSVAETLQQAILPDQVPAIPGMQIAVRYLPGVSGTEVGGDWYDVVPLGGGRFVFVVGDVSGRGVRAAAMMASLHYASRAYALEGHPPAVILDQLTQTMDIAEDGHFATVLCGLVDVGTHEVALANAGHLPPLVCGGDGASLVEAKPGSPIGVRGGAAFEPTLLTTAARGTLIAYTDGLVERRGETLDTGLKRLLQAATDRCGSSLDDLLTSLVSELTGDSPTDDIALIGLRWLN